MAERGRVLFGLGVELLRRLCLNGMLGMLLMGAKSTPRMSDQGRERVSYGLHAYNVPSSGFSSCEMMACL